MKNLILIVVLFFVACTPKMRPIDISRWTYMEIDSTRGKWGVFGQEPTWLRYFGLVMADVDKQNGLDIISGRYWYQNSGGDMTAHWKRYDFEINIDASLTLDVDGDKNIDIIGEDLPKVYWLEAANKEGTKWDTTMIGEIPQSDHRNGQGFRVADLNGDGKDEVLLAAGGGIYSFEIPKNPKTDKWRITLVAKTESSEGFDCADMDNDGDLDIVAGDMAKSKEEDPMMLKCYLNPGRISSNWDSFLIGTTIHSIDRVCTADFDHNGITDVVVSEERYPGNEPDAHLQWFKGTKSNESISYERKILVQQYSMNNLDVGDIDNDGDIDIVTNEHKGQEHKTQIFQNDGLGNFTAVPVDKGKESHLGTQLADMDQDGDLDIVSIAWDHYKYVHLWRNDGIKK